MKTTSLVGSILLVAAAAAAVAQAESGIRLRLAGVAYADGKDAGLKAPEGVAFAPNDLLIVADTGNGRLLQYAVTADAMTAGSEFIVPELPYPQRVAATSKGDVLVLDGRLRKIGRLSSGGAFAGYVPLPDGSVPRGLRVDATDQLWVLDVAGPRLLVLDPAGKVVREVALPGERGRFYSDVAVDAKGNAFVLESVGRRVLVVRAGGAQAEPFGESFRDDLAFATSIAVDASGHVFIADQSSGGIVTLGADGSFRGRQAAEGWRDGHLRYPSAVAADAKGRLFVADRGNNRIQVFTLVP